MPHIHVLALDIANPSCCPVVYEHIWYGPTILRLRVLHSHRTLCILLNCLALLVS